MKTISIALATLLATGQAYAQWAKVPDSNVPRTRDNQLDLSAPAPKTPDGRMDLSGVWLIDSDPVPADIQTVEGDIPLPRHMINITADMKPEDVPLLPSAAELLDQRLQAQGLDSPIAYCQPTGVPHIDAIPLPLKIVQTPDLILILYEENTVFRQIFLDGRETVEDPVPRFLGYSTGEWDGNELVVDTVGFNDQSWLDGMGHPHTDKMRVTERFRRLDVGHLEIEITIDDPGAYSASITYTLPLSLVPDDDLLEYFCAENEKDVEHYQQ